MKKIQQAGLLIFALIAFTYAQAQTTRKKDINEKIAGQFSQRINALNKADIAMPAEIKKVAAQKIDDDLVIEALRLLDAETERRQKELEALQKQYTPTSSGKPHQIDKDLLPLLAGMPEPITSLPQAKQALKGNYDNTPWAVYIEKLERYSEQMKDMARQNMPADMKDPEKIKQAAYTSAAKAQQDINNNPIIQEMGGLENLKNMTPAQREALAKQMAEKVKQNPQAYTGASNDPRKAFTQKMMMDPQYAAKYNAMNDAQKKEEYDAFLAKNGFVNNAKPQAGNTSDRDKAALVIAINKRIKTIHDHATAMAEVFGSIQHSTETYFADLYDKIAAQYEAIVAALPETEHGEAGHSKDTYPVDIANQMVLLPIHEQNAIANKDVWKREVDMLKVLIAEYNELLADYWGKDAASDRTLFETGITREGLIAGMCDEMISLR